MAGEQIVNSVLGSGIGAALGMIQGNQQQENSKELMGLQHKYNEISADLAQNRQKDMWNYTNYENQLKHMMNAGLSPGLMYGLNGGGGTSAGSGAQASVSGAQGSKPDMVQGGAMGLQLGAIQSQIELNQSAAEKNAADAAEAKSRIPGHEREAELKESQARLNNSQAELNKVQEGLVKANTKLSEAEYEVAISERDKNITEVSKIAEEMIKINAEGRLTNEQANWYGRVMANEIAMKTALTAKAYSDIQVNDQKMQNMQKEIESLTNDMVVKRMNANTARYTAEEAAKNWMKQNDLRGKELEQRVTEMWVNGIVSTYQTIVGQAGSIAKGLTGGK